MKIFAGLLTVFFSALSPVNSYGFPEMVRHNYVNCSSCHVSQNGGGVLTDYGRQTSPSVLTMWGDEEEAKPFYKAFEQPKWLDTGMFLREVQTAQNNSKASSGYFWWMQFDFEAAARFGEGNKWTADLALGISPDAANGLLPKGDSPLASRRQFLMYQPTVTTSYRAGKFLADYGVYFSEHTIATRQGIGFEEGSETYNLEWTYHDENKSGTLTAILGRPDDSKLSREKGFAATGAFSFSDQSKIGWSGYYGTQNNSSRELTGPYVLYGFTSKLYFMGEADFQFSQPAKGASTQGLFTYERIGYEVVQGVDLYLMQQTFVHSFSGYYQPLFQDLKYGTRMNRLYGVGPGLYWFPRPHFYFQLEVQQQFSQDLPSAQTMGFLTGNFYL